ncbi:MAG TPA: FAD-dependent monooxygenase, partial [Ilumatobacter sp.]|nr:FAD-dependent monooxygenase [Ilumatobacter sp.]
MDFRPDVIVVGFGPVGGALAGLLGRRGVNVLVIDRELDVFSLPRAAHVDHTGLRVWQELGVVDQLLESMRPNGGLELVSADHTLLVRVDGGQPSISGLPSSMYFYQPIVDRTIRDVVAALPSVSVCLGAELVDVVVEADRAVATIASVSGESVEIETSWIVGCDGASSTVRTRTGLDLQDLGFAEDWLVVDLVLSDELALHAPTSAICHCDPLRPSYSIPMPNNRHRLEFRLMSDDERRFLVDSAGLEQLFPAWMAGGRVTVERSAVYTFHGRVAAEWRHRRVLIAGDAAHQMPPFLGQGMCSGLRDAANLAWKLGRVLDGAPDALIDTY